MLGGTPPAPAQRHNSQGHGELGQRTSKLPTVRAGGEKEGKFPECLCLCVDANDDDNDAAS